MTGKVVLNRFIQKNPLAVMTRTIVGSLVNEELDKVFEQNRSRQYDDTIKFSTVAMSVAEIALGTMSNRNQAYRKYKDELQASVVAYYGKINRTELSEEFRKIMRTLYTPDKNADIDFKMFANQFINALEKPDQPDGFNRFRIELKLN